MHILPVLFVYWRSKRSYGFKASFTIIHRRPIILLNSLKVYLFILANALTSVTSTYYVLLHERNLYFTVIFTYYMYIQMNTLFTFVPPTDLLIDFDMKIIWYITLIRLVFQMFLFLWLFFRDRKNFFPRQSIVQL